MARNLILVTALITYLAAVAYGQSCQTTDNTDYKGPGNNAGESNLVILYNIASADACCQSCSTFEECKYFSYSKAAKGSATYQQCILKTSSAVSYSNSGYVSGVSSKTAKLTHAGSTTCSSPVSGIDYDNGFLGQTLYNTADYATCCSACRNYSGCNYFGYLASNKACYLKGSNANAKSNSAVVSGSIMTPAATSVVKRTGKRGLGVFDTSSCSDIKLMTGISWAYNWAAQADKGLKQCFIDQGIEYVPMQWGLPLTLSSIDTSAKYLLGFNEPNFKSQSNILPSVAAENWGNVTAFARANNMKIVSPSASAGGDSDAIQWLDQFFGNCTAKGVDCTMDAIATHIYSCYPGGVKGYTDGFKKYGKPIWLTEFACADWESGNLGITTWEKMQAYVNETLNKIEADPQYERYAYFGTRGGVGPLTGVFDLSKSALSPVGQTYNCHADSTGASKCGSSPSPSPSTPSPSPATPSPTKTPSPSPVTPSPSPATPSPSPATPSPTKTPSIYPKYIGCYIDANNARDLKYLAYRNSSNTVRLCTTACKALGKVYAGLQYGTECFCGNSYGNAGGIAANSTCNKPCPGLSTDICGGDARNSIYQVMDPAGAIADDTEPAPSSSASFTVFSLLALGCVLLVSLIM